MQLRAPRAMPDSDLPRTPALFYSSAGVKFLGRGTTPQSNSFAAGGIARPSQDVSAGRRGKARAFGTGSGLPGISGSHRATQPGPAGE